MGVASRTERADHKGRKPRGERGGGLSGVASRPECMRCEPTVPTECI